MKCGTCKYWKGADLDEDNLGDCLKLSSQSRNKALSSNKTGIEAWPLCVHDGKAFTFETKSWFGCIHHVGKQ